MQHTLDEQPILLGEFGKHLVLTSTCYREWTLTVGTLWS
jgi:hypothetical protein